MSEFDFLNPVVAKERIKGTHEDVVKDVEAYINTEKVKGKLSQTKYNNWKPAKFKYGVLNRITRWESVVEDLQHLGVYVAKKYKVTDKEVIEHYLTVAKYVKKRPTKKDYDKYHAEVKKGPNFTLITSRWTASKFHTLVWEYTQGKRTLHDISAAKQTKRKPISARMRAQILERDRYTCVKCGAKPIDGDVQLHLNHRLPVSKGGKNSLENLETTCQDCNLGMSDKIISAYQED